MRLGTCIAIELVVAIGAVSGVWIGVGYTTEIARDYLATHEAAAATPTTPARPTPERLPVAKLMVAAPALEKTVFGAPDGELLEPLRGAVTGAKLNHGGTSLSLRLDFASGARAAFKPEQTHPQSDPRREIAAYRIDRMLGIGHVPPAKSIAVHVDELIAGTDPVFRAYTEGRLADEAIARDGILRGEVSWWIPEIKNGKIGTLALDDSEGMARWEGDLQVGAARPIELADFLAQLATVVMFDVLIDNADRWSGNNAKVSLDGATLYFMDNTLAFSPYTMGHQTNLNPLQHVQVFPKQLVAKVRALTYDAIAAALAGGDDGGLAPLLTPIEIRAILARRDHLVSYIDALVAQYGESAVLALP